MSAVRTTSRLALGLLAGVLLLVFAVPTAGAQEEDPYGSTTTTAPEDEIEATCTISPVQAQAGDRITATVAGVFFGETVNINFDGTVVATKTAPDAVAQAASAPVVFGGAALASQPISTTLVIDFTVPANAAPGNHIVTATGDTFVTFCNPNGVFKVLGAAAGGGGGGGSLARTGIYVGLLLAIALVLLLGGRALLGASRRRRRQATMAFHLEDDRTMITPRR